MATWDQSVTAIATAAAAAGAFVAAWVAYNGLQDTALQLQGTTIYNVAKDGKALQRRFLKREADADEVMSYFYSVYRLHTSNVLGDLAWRPVEAALCRFSKDTTIEDVPRWWSSHEKLYDEDFRNLVNTLGKGASCPSP
jgi:hypothetical protein